MGYNSRNDAVYDHSICIVCAVADRDGWRSSGEDGNEPV